MEQQNINQGVIPGAKMMKTAGIIMIVFSALGFIFALITKGAYATYNLLISSLGEVASEAETLFGQLNTLSTINLILVALSLVIAIMATVQANKPKSPMAVVIPAIIYCVLMTAVNIGSIVVANNFYAAIDYPGAVSGTTYISLITSVILPILIIVGGFKKKKALNL